MKYVPYTIYLNNFRVVKSIIPLLCYSYKQKSTSNVLATIARRLRLDVSSLVKKIGSSISLHRVVLYRSKAIYESCGQIVRLLV